MDGSAEDQLDLLLDELDLLTEDDIPLLVEAWQREDDAARRRAWSRAKAEIDRRRLGGALDRARSEVGRWAAAGRSDYHGIGGLMGMPTREAQERAQAAPAILDAVVALLAGQALDDEEHAILAAPWQALQAEAEHVDDEAPGD
ncbi:MAG TPA: hypothetical protein VNT28_00480 [Candidatus Limnocylindrales bacterium]|jgi:hypothetical protein|nr:hypothetical protein [Candidatus Limnocylindrales bacterium]